MKEIITENFKKLSSDLITHPPVFAPRGKSISDSTQEEIEKIWKKPQQKKKKSKNIYQLNLNTEDIDVRDFGQTEVNQ